MVELTLREKREAAGLTRQEVAERAKCSLAYVQMVDSGFAPTIREGNAYSRVVAVIEKAAKEATAA